MSKLNKVGSHKTVIYADTSGQLKVKYHNTDVVTVHHDTDSITLNTGGWFSNTTKTRMNQASQQFNLGYSVHQKKYEWYVTTKHDGIKKFEGNTITFKR